MDQDWTNLDALFVCPDSVADQKLRDLYEVLVARTKGEIEAVEPTTGQLIQASLMIGWTVKHLSTSKAQYADKAGYQHPGQEKDAIMALETLLRGWNETMFKARAQRDRTSVGIPVKVVQDVLMKALSQLPQDVRMPVVSSVASGLSEYTG